MASHPDGIYEIGYYPVRATAAGGGIFDREMQVFQWHREGFELPEGAVLMAVGDAYPNQAYRYGDNAYALQFHPEVTEAMNRLWARRGAQRLGAPGAQSVTEQLRNRARYDPGVERWLDRFLRFWLESGVAKASTSRRVAVPS